MLKIAIPRKQKQNPVQWLTPVILEADIEKIMVGDHPGQKLSETPSQPVSWVRWHMPVIPTT
jgi:hypothetical protein